MRFLTRDPIDARDWHARTTGAQDGAAVEFLGIVRNEEAGARIKGLQYDAYAPMAERMIEGIVRQAQERWPLHRIEVRHRIGWIPVSEIAVLIGVEAPHRDEAFAACRFLIDAIKADVPIWKHAGQPAAADA